MTCYHYSALPDYALQFIPKNVVYLQTLPSKFRPHIHIHTYHEGSGSTEFSTWLERSSPWEDLGPRLRRFSPSGFSLDFFYMGIGPCGPAPPSPGARQAKVHANYFTKCFFNFTRLTCSGSTGSIPILDHKK
jgi:hypothetical protein